MLSACCLPSSLCGSMPIFLNSSSWLGVRPNPPLPIAPLLLMMLDALLPPTPAPVSTVDADLVEPTAPPDEVDAPFDDITVRGSLRLDGVLVEPALDGFLNCSNADLS